jgi:hypothetical protein
MYNLFLEKETFEKIKIMRFSGFFSTFKGLTNKKM